MRGAKKGAVVLMKRSSPQESELSQYTTEMMRVVISGVKKQSSPWESFFSFLWLIGALLVIVVYILIPVLIALHHIFTMLFELLLAAAFLLIAEIIVSAILLKIARPSPVPSVTPRRYQLNRPSPVTPLPIQAKISNTDPLLSPVQRPVTPAPASQFVRVQSAIPSSLTVEVPTVETPFVFSQRLKLPTR